MDQANWYALRSSAHKEGILHKQLLSKNIECFFPCVKVNPINPRSAKWRPFFPNYMFVKTKIEEIGNSTFNTMPFSQGLVEFGGQAAVIPSRLIQEIQAKLEEINIGGGIEYGDLKPGMSIRVTEGPFRGYEGIFNMRLSGTDRALILLKMIKRTQMRVEMPVGAIKRLNS